MAYSGFLLKIGDYTVPHSFIKAESYSATRNVQDVDSYRDADGVLHREPLEHVPIKIEFETPAMLTNTQIADFFGNIKKNYTNELQRKAIATMYVPETDEYITQDVYMVQPVPQIYGIFDNVIKYKPIRIAFVGY